MMQGVESAKPRDSSPTCAGFTNTSRTVTVNVKG